jgi:glycosyltransferase involved in cell wall biosynthesis
MNILMISNTYTPIVGGLETSIENFTAEYRKMGHNVLIVAPEFKDMPDYEEEGVLRVPALQHFNGTDFSVQLPVPGILSGELKKFNPDIVHSHHPFLMGDTALRISASREIPIVFTFHTLYERYTHYVPGDSPAMKKFVIELSSGYANLCDRVFAPSAALGKLLSERNVKTPVEVIPTGIYPDRYTEGDGEGFRRKHNIKKDSLAVGFVSRIAKEKNIVFLARAVIDFLKKNKKAVFLTAGDGPLREDIMRMFEKSGLKDRFIYAGTLKGRALIDAYCAMDVFVFASCTETQGLVLTEAMVVGVLFMALKAFAVTEIVKDGKNGRLIETESADRFSAALEEFSLMNGKERNVLRAGARETAKKYSMEILSKKALSVYYEAIERGYERRGESDNTWENAKDMVKTEWNIMKNITRATGSAIEEGMVSGNHEEKENGR